MQPECSVPRLQEPTTGLRHETHESIKLCVVYFDVVSAEQ
jgi:hypothetical protein